MSRYPVVLAHGIARFDKISQRLFRIDNNDGLDRLHYFKNIRTFLKGRGYVVYHTSVSWAGSVATRAAQLKRQIDAVLDETGAEKVHVVAHSMGGLDGRRALFDFRDEGFHDKISSLTTIGTPHHGSPVADLVVNLLGLGPSGRTNRARPLPPELAPLVSTLGIDEGRLENATGLPAEVAGVLDLTTWACRDFNERARSFERECGVRFRTVAGVQSWQRTFTALKGSWRVVFDAEGSNDGLVSERSARWDDAYFLGPVWGCDHLNQLGWWEPAELWGGTPRWWLERQVKRRYLALLEGLHGN